MNVDKLHKDAADASRAKELVENEMLQGAFDALEEAYIAHWRASRIDDDAGREKLFIAVNIVGKVRQHLATIIANGTLAAADLEKLAAAAEREKRFA